MLKMIFFDEDPDEVLKEEDIRAVAGSSSREEVEMIDLRETEEVNNVDFVSFSNYAFSPLLQNEWMLNIWMTCQQSISYAG